MGLKKRVRALEEALERAIQKIEEQNKVIDTLRKEIQLYKNSNTPSSANKHLKPNTLGNQVEKNAKRGAPIGHEGKTRKQIPQRKEIIDCDECPNCHGHHLKDDKIIKQIIEEVQEPIAPEVIEGEIHKKKCLDCGIIFIPPQNIFPLKGSFGINLMILVIFIKFILRGVLRKTSSFLEVSHAFDITPASINEIIGRVAESADKEYESLKLRIRDSTKIYIDETSFSVLGKNQWVWVFRTETDILLVIRPSRGSNVLEEILGKDYAGTIICDCWRAYNFLALANIQRCWSHLLRKSKELISVAGIHLHEKLKELFEEIKKFNLSAHTVEERLAKYDEMTQQLKELISYYSKYPELMPVVKYIDFNLENWFTCIKVEGIEPTNNFAERALRESVLVRKIIGAFRSETGKESYQTLASVIASWQLKGLDLKVELKKMLIKNLCFC
ncbi:MAG: IS66 family transposase [Nanoarchaeota archaeon]